MHDPLLHFRLGEHVMLHMINETDYFHPMHLHGHFFRVMAVNGQKTRFREWRDTVLMGPRSSVDHAAGGMMGTVIVE